MNSDAPPLWSIAYQAKVIKPEKIEAQVKLLRQARQTIATLNGSFDLLHAGHLQIIYEASLAADVLIVALNTDASIQKYKSPKRPLVPLEYRLQMMAALEFVDFITWFDEVDPRRILRMIQPDIHVNGAEYGMDCIEASIVQEFGGKIHLVERIPSLSTSLLIEKIQAESSTCV